MYMVRWCMASQNSLNFRVQVQTKYYRLLKALVDHLGNEMPPKPYKQAAIQSALLIHWDKVTTAFFLHVLLCLHQFPLS